MGPTAARRHAGRRRKAKGAFYERVACFHAVVGGGQGGMPLAWSPAAGGEHGKCSPSPPLANERPRITAMPNTPFWRGFACCRAVVGGGQGGMPLAWLRCAPHRRGVRLSWNMHPYAPQLTTRRESPFPALRMHFFGVMRVGRLGLPPSVPGTHRPWDK
jgi:hypothetical protein